MSYQSNGTILITCVHFDISVAFLHSGYHILSNCYNFFIIRGLNLTR